MTGFDGILGDIARFLRQPGHIYARDPDAKTSGWEFCSAAGIFMRKQASRSCILFEKLKRSRSRF